MEHVPMGHVREVAGAMATVFLQISMRSRHLMGPLSLLVVSTVLSEYLLTRVSTTLRSPTSPSQIRMDMELGR